MIKKKKFLSSEVTSEKHYYNKRQYNRRQFLGVASSAAGALVAFINSKAKAEKGAVLSNNSLKANSYQEITHYNNYYEFSTNKEAVHILAKELTLEPWTINISGEVEKSMILSMEDVLKSYTQEERIYSLRCVEGWSMVIPWTGFSLNKLLNKVKPTSKAKYVEFISLLRPSEMIGQRLDTLQWPYTEALTITEAMHPLTILATGLYGKPLPSQNGAPIRLVVPWKYGFKSLKAITHIRFTEYQPKTTWQIAVPSEYGFYGNVNPNVPHPRWSQSRENRIGELRKRKTLLFNGYAEDVAHLYSGIDLKTNY